MEESICKEKLFRIIILMNLNNILRSLKSKKIKLKRLFLNNYHIFLFLFLMYNIVKKLTYFSM